MYTYKEEEKILKNIIKELFNIDDEKFENARFLFQHYESVAAVVGLRYGGNVTPAELRQIDKEMDELLG